MATMAAGWGLRLLAVASGACLALTFPPVNAWWWAWLGLVPLLLLVARAGTYAEAAGRSWLAAVGFFVTVHHWVVPYLEVFSVLAAVLVGLAWVPFGLAAHALLRRSSPRGVLAAIVVLPSTWLTIEVLRSWKHLGGAWGVLGYSQWTVRPVLALAAVGGVWLLSMTLVAVNVAVAAVVLPGTGRRTRLVAATIAVGLAAAAVAYGLQRPEAPVTGTARVAGVQAGVVRGAQERIAAHLRHTRDLAGVDHDVVVWGQSSVSLDPGRRPDLARQLSDAAATVGSPLLVNVDAGDPSGSIRKATYQYDGDGLVATYTKQRLAPFGEYIPLRTLLGWIADHTEAAAVDRSTGDGLVTLQVPGLTIGPLISYESTFPDMRRDLARLGADITIVQGSLTTFHGTWALPQQAGIEAVRAVESGRPAVLVQLSGTSTAFDARGRQLVRIPPGQAGGFVIDVPLSKEQTPYVRLGDWVPALAGAVLAATLIVLVTTRHRRQARGSPTEWS